MADNLRVTLPLVNKSQVIDPKKNVDIPQFNLQDVTKVKQTSQQAELLMQNNTLLGDDASAAVLVDLLKDPAVTVTFLKNILMLKEIVGLLPMGNNALTGELERMFSELMLMPDELVNEMTSQGEAATKFRGELFETLRTVFLQLDSDQTRKNVVDLLKSLSQFTTKQDVLNAVANNLQYLSEGTNSSKMLSGKLAELSAQLRQPGAELNFESLKESVMQILSDVQDSILYSPKMEKVVSITVYNLSRFADSSDSLQQALARFSEHLPDERAKTEFLQNLLQFIFSDADNTESAKLAAELSGAQVADAMGEAANADAMAQIQELNKPSQSKVLNILADIIGKQAGSEEVLRNLPENLEKIIQSLLSSPTNFTPLLHYVVPLMYEDIESFMEMWINPNGEDDEPEKASDYTSNTHLLMVFDIGSVGRFELEMYVRDKTIDMFLFCPTPFVEIYSAAQKDLANCVTSLDYTIGELRVDGLDRTRSLMEVFTSLPHKRTGVDVRV